MYLFALNYLGFIVVAVFFILFGLLGGYIAKEDNNSFLLGFVIGSFGNIIGLLILLYISGTFKKRTSEPNFKDRASSTISAIETLSELNEKDKLSDQEFKRLKNEIISDAD